MITLVSALNSVWLARHEGVNSSIRLFVACERKSGQARYMIHLGNSKIHN